MSEQANPADALGELAAMQTVHGALAALAPAARGRVLAWVIGALEVPMSVAKGPATGRTTDKVTDSGDEEHDAASEEQRPSRFTEFADLLGEAQPQTDAEKALVGGYWFQVIGGADDFTSQAVNDRLKDTGEAIGNITRAFERLKATKPQQVRQLQKQGKSQQARKKFKLTTAGIQAVERMLRSGE